jgi:hypothetical protein
MKFAPFGRPTFVALLVLSVLLPTEALLACDCAPTKGPLEAGVRAGFDEASAVFSAEVVEVEDFQAGFEHFQATKLRVIESWKGAHSPGSTVRTVTITDCCLCGITVKRGQKFLVYVHGWQPYKLSDCSRTQALDDAGKEIEVLRKVAGDSA